MYVAPKRCPRCRYERRSSDTAPDWQCPSCEVAYVKAEVAASVEPIKQAVIIRGRGNGRFTGWGVALLIVVAAAIFGFQKGPAMVGLHSAAAASQPEVVMYATAWCGYCAKARSFFQNHGIDYVEFDIERDAEAAQIYERLGGGGVPTIQVGETIVHGFNEVRLSGLLGAWLK